MKFSRFECKSDFRMKFTHIFLYEAPGLCLKPKAIQVLVGGVNAWLGLLLLTWMRYQNIRKQCHKIVLFPETCPFPDNSREQSSNARNFQILGNVIGQRHKAQREHIAVLQRPLKKIFIHPYNQPLILKSSTIERTEEHLWTSTMPILLVSIQAHFAWDAKRGIVLRLSTNVSKVNRPWDGSLDTCPLLSMRSSGTANRALWKPRGPMVAGDLCHHWRLRPLGKKRKKKAGWGVGCADKRRARLKQAGWWIDYMIQDLSH